MFKPLQKQKLTSYFHSKLRVTWYVQGAIISNHYKDIEKLISLGGTRMILGESVYFIHPDITTGFLSHVSSRHGHGPNWVKLEKAGFTKRLIRHSYIITIIPYLIVPLFSLLSCDRILDQIFFKGDDYCFTRSVSL